MRELVCTFLFFTAVGLLFVAAIPYVLQAYDNWWCTGNKYECHVSYPEIESRVKHYPATLPMLADSVRNIFEEHNNGY